MTVAATGITIFHPPADPELFDRWLDTYLDSARRAAGFVSARRSVQRGEQLDHGVATSFDSAATLDGWLDGADRRAVLADGHAQGFQRSTADLMLVDGEPAPANATIFLHRVAAGNDVEFVAAQGDLTVACAAFPGYEGTALFPADESGQWMSLLRFRTAGQLSGWIRSAERRHALPRLRDELTDDFAELPSSAPFGSTVRIADGQTKITPAWKTAMLVVLCLYPTVMLLTKWLSPALAGLGIATAPAIFVGNVISVVLLQWVLVPAASRPFRRWLDPIDGASVRTGLTGSALVVVGCGALVLLFGLLG